jgi:hypothetical protein
MQRLVVLASVLALGAPSTASADCASTCGDVCNAPEASALFRAEVVATTDGFLPRVQIVERLGGSAEVAAMIGDEIEDVYAEVQVSVGDELVLTLASFDDGSGDYQWSIAWRIDSGEVVCSTIARTVPLEQYVAMAASSECEAIAVDLKIANRCDDTPGCTAAGAPSLLAALAALAALGLGVRRRSRGTRRGEAR